MDLAGCRVLPMTAGQAAGYLSWEYPAPYTLYNIPTEYRERELAVMEANIGSWFAVLDREERMIGFFEYSFDAAGRMEIGLGLRPDCTGQGCGADFTRLCVRFGREHYQYRGPVLLRVIQGNDRAFRAYRKAGFRVLREERAEAYGNPITFLWMRLDGEETPDDAGERSPAL